MNKDNKQVVMLEKVRTLKSFGYEFAVCWNFSKDVMKVWERIRNTDINKVPDRDVQAVKAAKEAVKGVFFKQEFGKEYALVFLERGYTVRDEKGRVRPTYIAHEALRYLGLIPIHVKFNKTLHEPELKYYYFATEEEVVSFL